ncbi:hypothetical protein OAJ52_08125 [Bacteroidia bacterium]|nr:hypothetical protein [Bacteroidia bacterium]
MMRNIRYVFALFTFFVLSETQAQDNKHSVALYQNLTDPNVDLLNNELFAFDSALYQSFRVAYVRRLSRTWMLNTGVNNGFVLNQDLKETFIPKAYALGVDIGVQFKLNNGWLMKENPFIAPFLSFGYRMDYIHKLKEYDKSPWFFNNQYGAGFNLRMSKKTHIQTQVAMGPKLLGASATTIEYRVGLIHSLGKANQELVPNNPDIDSDQDGLVDSKDDCPGLFGSARNNGCPDTLSYFAKKVYCDSVEELALSQQKRISDLELQNAKLRSGGDTGVITAPSVPTDRNYYVITMSSPNISTAEAWLKKMKDNFPDALILPQPNGYYRVGIYAAKNKELGLEILEKVKKIGYVPAWLSLE